MRIFILMFLLITNIFAQPKYELIEDLLFSTDNKEFISVFENDDLQPVNKFFIKIVLNKEVLKYDSFYMKFAHDYKILKYANVPSKIEDNATVIYVNKDTPKEIVLECETKFKDPSFDLTLYSVEEFLDLPRKEYMFLGVSYGIIFCAFLYNFVLFIFNRQKTFLYYSIFEISLLLLLILLVMTPDIIKPFYNYFNVSNVVGHLVLIFAILFNISFLELKKYVPKVEIFLKLLLALHVIDMCLMIFGDNGILVEYLPTSFVAFVLLLTSLLVYRQGYKIAIFYILGWGVIFLSLFFVEMDSLEYPDIYALHFGLPLESLILSLTLGYKVKKLEEDKVLHAQMLIHQNKLASMGEMINNIAHQYRQPLTHLGYILMNIKSAFEHNELDKKYLGKKMNQANDQLNFMSKTIDNFRDFYKPNKEKEEFYINDSLNSAIDILKPVFKEKSIELSIDMDDKLKILGYENEYSQVVLNLLTNAKDALIEDDISNPKIEISLKTKKTKTVLSIKDNALGVPKKYEEKIFEPYFSTKTKSSGIGLYMSTMIIQEHFNGKLYLKNSKEGATFVIEV